MKKPTNDDRIVAAAFSILKMLSDLIKDCEKRHYADTATYEHRLKTDPKAEKPPMVSWYALKERQAYQDALHAMEWYGLIDCWHVIDMYVIRKGKKYTENPIKSGC